MVHIKIHKQVHLTKLKQITKKCRYFNVKYHKPTTWTQDPNNDRLKNVEIQIF